MPDNTILSEVKDIPTTLSQSVAKGQRIVGRIDKDHNHRPEIGLKKRRKIRAARDPHVDAHRSSAAPGFTSNQPASSVGRELYRM